MKSNYLIVMGTIAALMLAACAPAPTPAPTAAPPTAAPVATVAPAATSAPAATAVPPTATSAPRVKLNVAFSSLNPDPLTFWVAKDAGLFDKNNLDVTLTFIDGGTKTTAALISKDVQFASTAPSSPVAAASGGADLIMIGGVINSPNYDFIVQPAIKSGADLKGKKVGVSNLSGSSYTAARIAIRDFMKLDPDKDVTYVAIGTEPEREAAMLAKQLDATVGNPDTTSIQAKKDGLVILVSLWNQPIAYQHTGIAASKAYLSANKDTVDRFMRSIIQATGYIKDPKNKDSVIKSLSTALKLDDKVQLETAYTRASQTLLQCAPYVTLDGMKTVIAENKDAVAKGLTPESMTDNSFVKALDDSGFVKANCK